VADLRSLLWSSIDNDDSRDLDQIEYAAEDEHGIRLFIGIADVDWFVPRNSPLDEAAAHNTTSIYTGVETFPMLPGRLSTDLSSLNQKELRLSVVVEILLDAVGQIIESKLYPAIVENKAQLTYNAVGPWLDAKPGEYSIPAGSSEAATRAVQQILGSRELQDQLRLQDRAAELLRERRHEAGALAFDTIELQPVMSDGLVSDLGYRRRNRASLLIEDLMIAANHVTALFLERAGMPSVRRVVRVPDRWDRIVAVAASLGTVLPPVPDAKSLSLFLKQQKDRAPERFADLSFLIIKLLGRGEYVLKTPGAEAPGHFGLAAADYAHSTAPNRRYPDLLTQRLLKASFAGQPCPYSNSELGAFAKHCTEKENDANRVERFVKKCAAAVFLAPRIGEEFKATVSGINASGTWVRLAHPPVEGKLESTTRKLDVGDPVSVRLVSTNPEKGFIDFELIG
jgi:exoribonuclease-2